MVLALLGIHITCSSSNGQNIAVVPIHRFVFNHLISTLDGRHFYAHHPISTQACIVVALEGQEARVSYSTLGLRTTVVAPGLIKARPLAQTVTIPVGPIRTFHDRLTNWAMFCSHTLGAITDERPSSTSSQSLLHSLQHVVDFCGVTCIHASRQVTCASPLPSSAPFETHRSSRPSSCPPVSRSASRPGHIGDDAHSATAPPVLLGTGAAHHGQSMHEQKTEETQAPPDSFADQAPLDTGLASPDSAAPIAAEIGEPDAPASPITIADSQEVIQPGAPITLSASHTAWLAWSQDWCLSEEEIHTFPWEQYRSMSGHSCVDAATVWNDILRRIIFECMCVLRGVYCPSCGTSTFLYNHRQAINDLNNQLKKYHRAVASGEAQQHLFLFSTFHLRACPLRYLLTDRGQL